MIEYCSANYPQQRWLVSNIPYEFVDDSFDYCVIVNVLHHLNSRADVASMLREAKRLAKNVVLFEPLQSETPILYLAKRLYWAITDGGNPLFAFERVSRAV